MGDSLVNRFFLNKNTDTYKILLMFERIKELVQKRSSVKDIKEDDKLSDLDMDSLDLVAVMIEIEEEFNVEFTSEEILDIKTIKDVIKLIERKRK